MEGVMMRTQVKSLPMKMKCTLGRIGMMQASMDHGFEKDIIKLKVQCYSKMNGKTDNGVMEKKKVDDMESHGQKG
eukprot:14915556-Ditylum_brightwellii.AAC.1